MIWLGLFLALASIPGYTSAAIPAGWAALSLTLPIVAWRQHPLCWPHVAMGLFLLYVFASIAWSFSPFDGIFRLWQFALIAGCFWLGTVREPKPILTGLAYGYMVSTVLALGQWLNLDIVLRLNENNFPGLYYSGVFSGAVGAMLLIALACERLWLLALACIPGIILSSIHSRGAVAAVLVGLAALCVRRVLLLPLAIAAILAFAYYSGHNSDIERRAIWRGTMILLTPFGWGAGSYIDLSVITPFSIVRAEHAHNDLLQLLFEFGIGALPYIAVWVALILYPSAKHWPVIACFTVLSVFFFPLYTPLSAVIFALCAGASVRDWRSPSDLLHSLRRFNLLRKAKQPVPVSLPT